MLVVVVGLVVFGGFVVGVFGGWCVVCLSLVEVFCFVV